MGAHGKAHFFQKLRLVQQGQNAARDFDNFDRTGRFQDDRELMPAQARGHGGPADTPTQSGGHIDQTSAAGAAITPPPAMPTSHRILDFPKAVVKMIGAQA